MTGNRTPPDRLTSKRPGLVIFDCDGILVDSEPITNRELARDLSARGLPISPEECINLFVGGTISGVKTQAIELGATLPDDWVDQTYARMIAALEKEVEIIPGVEDVLDQLDAKKIPYCVASNGPVRKMKVTLTRTGLWDRFDGQIHSAHTIGKAKPDPALFLHAADSAGIAATDTIVIEDSASGAKAARRAGMQCFGYTDATPVKKLTDEGAVPFATMASLPALLGLA